MNRRCVDCGTEMGPWVTRDVPYDCGLPGVVLHDVEVATCPECRAEETRIPNVLGLHRTLAHLTAEWPESLSGDQVRFLRKHLGWSGQHFAEKIDCRPETVSRWETGKRPTPKPIEQLLRMYVLHGEPPITDYARHDDRRAPRVVLERKRAGQWEPTDIAAK